jgi:hypothetical protein
MIAILLSVWIAAGAYTGKILMRGWVPHDDGVLAQSAERVLHGQLPHRDFIEVYTGGLSYLYAFAFRVFGVNLGSLRLMMFLFFLAWVPVVYFVAAELAPDWIAGALTLLAVVWSVPNYTAPMPSWYNLFFATFGAAALFAYIRKPFWGWLFAAGVCGGLSFLVKSVGLYFVAGVLLFLVYREQNDSRRNGTSRKWDSTVYSAFIGVSLFGFLSMVAALIRHQAGASEVFHFLVPQAALSVVLIWGELGTRRSFGGEAGRSTVSSARRFQALFRMATPFLAGTLLPVALFLTLYFRENALPYFFYGVFVLPAKRVLGAFMHPPKPQLLLPALLFASLVFLSYRMSSRIRALIAIAVGVSGVILLVASFRNAAAYAVLWESAQGMLLVLTVGGAALLIYFQSAKSPPGEPAEQRVMILVSLSAACSLVQFPFAAPIYFCYVAPLMLLAAAAIVAACPRPPRALLASAGTLAFFFAVLVLRPGGLQPLGWQYAMDRQTAMLELPRAGGLRVSPEMEKQYDMVIPLLQEHAGGHTILAAPDCPEIYFLGGFENPTRSMFEMFEEREGYRERIEKLVDENHVKALLLNPSAGFSGSFLGQLRIVADEKFPNSKLVGEFEVRWRP